MSKSDGAEYIPIVYLINALRKNTGAIEQPHVLPHAFSVHVVWLYTLEPMGKPIGCDPALLQSAFCCCVDLWASPVPGSYFTSGSCCRRGNPAFRRGRSGDLL